MSLDVFTFHLRFAIVPSDACWTLYSHSMKRTTITALNLDAAKEKLLAALGTPPAGSEWWVSLDWVLQGELSDGQQIKEDSLIGSD